MVDTRDLDGDPHALFDAPSSTHAPIDEAGWRTIDLKLIWEGLMTGALDVEDALCSEARCFIVLKPARAEKRAEVALYAKKLVMLERALLGNGQKVSAAEFGIAVSTVSFATRQALEFLGFRSVPAKPPLILVLLAHAARAPTPQFGRQSRTIWNGVECSIVSVGRPDLSLQAVLPPSEYAVTRLLVEGRSHAEIAQKRHTSLRTIANQLASAFHRLKISGRAELLAMVVSRAN